MDVETVTDTLGGGALHNPQIDSQDTPHRYIPRKEHKVLAVFAANQRVVDEFMHLSSLTVIAEGASGVPKLNAYKSAAQALAGAPEELTLQNYRTFGDGGSKKLKGVGKAVTAKLGEFLEVCMGVSMHARTRERASAAWAYVPMHLCVRMRACMHGRKFASAPVRAYM